MNEGLKPCPFCGGDARTMEMFGGTFVTCGNVNCALDVEVTRLTWNTRPVEDALRARIAELERSDELLDAVIAAVQPFAHAGETLHGAIARRIAELEAAQRPIPFSERGPHPFQTVWCYDVPSEQWIKITGEQAQKEMDRLSHWLPMPPAPEDAA